jgi:DNA repair exonuclease SbcCD ATPase subunit
MGACENPRKNLSGVIMKIIKLKSENVKRIKAVEIEPNGNIVKITGKNGEGKTSVLDSIMWALSGKDSIQSMPIRKGSDKATIELDLGKYKIVRSITSKGAYIKVTTSDGASYPSPQKLLDEIVGKLSFDPLEFIRMQAKEQSMILRKLSGIDLTALDAKEKELFDLRRDAKREADRTAAVAMNAPLPENAPDALVSAADLTTELQEAIKHNQAIDDLESSISGKQERIKQIKTQIANLQSSLKDAEKSVSDQEKQLAGMKPIDTDELRGKLSTIESDNELYRKKIAHDKAAELAKNAASAHKKLDDELESIRKNRKEIISSASYPLEGLAISEDGNISFNDIPIDQISLAEQIRVSTAVSMSLNPELRVIRITDGSLLDSTSLSVITELANDNDYQIWIEMVDESGEVGFYIEDGLLVSIDGKEPVS